MLHGLEDQLPLPEPQVGDADSEPNTDRHAPHSLAEALDAVEKDTVLTEAIGADLMRTFVSVKRADVTRSNAAVTDWRSRSTPVSSEPELTYQPPPHGGTMEPVESAAAHLAHGKLTTIDCVSQSLAVGPIFSAAAIGAILAALSGGVSPFVVVLTTVGILGIGYCVSEFAKRYSGSGTVYEFIAHSLGKKPAIFTAGAYHFAALALGGPGIGIIVGIQAHLFFDAHMGIDLPWWVWGLFFSAVIMMVNIVGVQVSVRTQLTIIGLSLVPFIILIVAILADGGPNGISLDSFNPSNVVAPGSVFKGLLFAILMFVGFELAAAARRGDR